MIHSQLELLNESTVNIQEQIQEEVDTSRGVWGHAPLRTFFYF